MKFSIVMASTLAHYRGAASNREEKLVRAIESVLAQTHEDWELLIVADGCDKTIEICKPFFYEYMPKIRLFKIPKQKTWAGSVRNVGISKAEGDIIVYLDNDDMFGINHLKIINDNFGDYDWVYFDHLIYSPTSEDFSTYHTDINTFGRCGTCSIAFKRSLDAYWSDSTYKHDYYHIQEIKSRSLNFGRIPKTEYMVCHAPNRFDY